MWGEEIERVEVELGRMDGGRLRVEKVRQGRGRNSISVFVSLGYDQIELQQTGILY